MIGGCASVLGIVFAIVVVAIVVSMFAAVALQFVIYGAAVGAVGLIVWGIVRLVEAVMRNIHPPTAPSE